MLKKIFQKLFFITLVMHFAHTTLLAKESEEDGFASQGLHLDLLMGFGNLSLDIYNEDNTSYFVAELGLAQEYVRFLDKNISHISSWHVEAYKSGDAVIAVAYNDKFVGTLLYDLMQNRGSFDFANIEAVFQIQNDFLTLDATTSSLKELLLLLGVDKDVDASMQLHLETSLSQNSTLHGALKIPSYLYQDESNIYQESNSSIEFTFKESSLHLQNYNIGFKDSRYYSDKESIISLNSDGNIGIDSLWIYDNLLLHGMYDTTLKETKLHLTSQEFHYDQYDSNVTLRADVDIKIGQDGEANINGEIELLDGVVGYMPKEEFIIQDEDIILLQDERVAQQQQNRSVNLHIFSLHPIAYRYKENTIFFLPNINATQANSVKLSVVGDIRLLEGDLRFYDKDFKLLKSEIVFDADPTNPSLFVTLHHTTEDDVNIEIYITKRVENPLILFSSSPSMSQNDILSYLLFGQSSAGAFDIQDDGASSQNIIAPFLLSSSLKKVLNDTTPLQIDKLNILTNETGGYGYEVGAKLGKDLRIVYKNNEIATVILQYRLTRSLRFDVDLRESGQGASIIYMKDFDFHMPWHVEEQSAE
jgi:hypothetical protein